MLVRVVEAINVFLNSPRKVFLICITVVFVTLLLDGTFLKIWALSLDIKKIQSNLNNVNFEIEKIEKQIHQANEPSYIEREARDRFDLVEDNDLVFVFAGEDEI